LKDHKAIRTAEINNNEKPINSAPILRAIKRVYDIAVITPLHSNKFEVFTLKKASARNNN